MPGLAPEPSGELCMDIIETTVRKLDGALDRAEGLLSARLIQDDAGAAAQKLFDLFKVQRDDIVAELAQVTNADVIATRCDVALAELVRWTPLLGLIHRSKSSANPFEMYGPLLALAQRVIQPDIRLVVSSEWDFSPFTMPHGTTLEGFVFVGMPATIPDKALLMSLAGHEFGHSVWVIRNARSVFEQATFQAVWNRIRARLNEVLAALAAYHISDEDGLLSLDGLRAWRSAYWWALQQAEELFCDLFGLRLFGAAYADAFAYLLAPGLIDHRVQSYPHPRSRAEVLGRAAAQWGITVSADFLDGFPPAKAGSAAPGGLLGDIADTAVLDLVDLLVAEVEAHANDCRIDLPRSEVIEAVRQDLAMVVPTDRDASLAELLCAGWRVRTDSGIWASLPHIRAERYRVLDDLILKSAQVLEYHQRIRADAA